MFWNERSRLQEWKQLKNPEENQERLKRTNLLGKCFFTINSPLIKRVVCLL